MQKIKLFSSVNMVSIAIQIIGEEFGDKIKIITVFPVRRRRYGI